MMRPLWLILILGIQMAFIAAGLAITFWTINEWDQDRRLNAVFGAGVGSYGFFFTWLLMRNWVRGHSDLWRRPNEKV